MAIYMTFNRYMDNPSAGTSTFTNRGMYKAMYKDKFDKLLVREQGRIAFKIYRTQNSTDTYYIVFKIPSESMSEFYYDVVVELSAHKNEYKNSPNLRMYDVRFYSNDQAFIYAFAYAFNKHGLFIPLLRSKMSKVALEQKSLSRNPRADIWYVKSLCFAFFVMERYNLFSRSMLNQNAVKFNQSDLFKNVSHSDTKLEEYNKKKKDIKLRKQAEKDILRSSSRASNIRKSSDIDSNIRYIQNTKTTKYTGKISHTSRTKRI